MEYKGFTYTPTPKTAWDNLSMLEKSEMMKVAVRHGITNLQNIRAKYNEFAEGGDTTEDTQQVNVVGYPLVDAASEGLTEYFSNNPNVAGMAIGAGLNGIDGNRRIVLNPNLTDRNARNSVYMNESYRHYFDANNTALPALTNIQKNAYIGTPYEGLDTQIQRTEAARYLSGDPSHHLNDAQKAYLDKFDFIYPGGRLPEITVTGNKFAEGGGIHIKDSKKGTFTTAAKKHGMGVQEFASKVLAHPENYSPAMRKKANFARNAAKWHGLGGNLFDGTSEGTQQMQIGIPFWQSQTQEPSFMESLAEFNRQQKLKEQQQRQALREKINTVGKKLAEERMREASIESNDNAWVDTPLTYKKKNPHLSRRAEEGAKAHAAWKKEHPVLNTIGTSLGAAPFAVAAIPVVGAAVEVAPAVASALAPGSAFWMNPITGQVATSTLGGKAVDLATTTVTPYSSWGKGISDVVNRATGWNPNDSWWGSVLTDMTNPGYLTPYSLVENSTIKAANAIEDVANNWRPWVPRDANRYYRIVGESGDPIGDAIQSGVVRGPGANPNARASMEATMKAKPIKLAAKAHSYPMFSKGKPWEGSTSRIDGKEKPIIIRSKADTGPVKWEESNVDFSHKGHKGIFRPNYYGELNSTPTRYFEYWEPKMFGYMRREFPVDTNPYHNLMGRGYTVDRGNWMESDLGVEGEKFGKYVGSGGEQTVFEDTTNPNNVLKAYHDTYTKTPEGLQDLVNDYLRRNSIPLQEHVSFTGYVKQDGYVYPVFNQGRLLPLGSMSNAEFNAKYLPLLQKSLKPYGYTGDGISSEFTNGVYTLVDIKPENMGLTPTGELRFLDVDWVTR